ncbi:M48 family metallopeptidase [Caldimonas sp. KR1-144]|uniref:M48 family metallopeptidase n=1 Tax=Caldimonas sp. KR1-144 TaxID=3400911 RepID=UPI003C0E1852
MTRRAAPHGASQPHQFALPLFGDADETPAPSSTPSPLPLNASDEPALAVPRAAAQPPDPPPDRQADHRHPRAQREIVLGGVTIGYELVRARRRSIGMVVSADGLSVRAPRWVGQGDIDTALREKSRWIVAKLGEQRERARKQAAAKIDWRDGTTLPFLGESVVLVLDARIAGAMLDSGEAVAQPGLSGVPRLTLHVGLPQTATPEQIKDTVQAWLMRQARRVFEERCAIYAERLGVRVTRLALSSAQTRWGSASADGSIRLNWRLIHFALPTIDYVVAHELAHLRHMDHSPKFWDVVRSVIPDMDAVRERLRDPMLPALD